ncbi:hypothetical protein BH11BAC1_BH11BAC1_00480 [soil metagenome]
MTKLLPVFFIYYINAGTAQVIDTTIKANHNFALSFAIGPQISMTDQNDFMIGPNVLLNSLWYRHVQFSLDLHGAFTNHVLDDSQYLVEGITSVSLTSGYRLYLNRYSALQIQGGFGYGELTYRGERHYNRYYMAEFDRQKIKFIGIPIKFSYELYHKMVGLEIYLATNFHPHYEFTAGVNFLLGRLR